MPAPWPQRLKWAVYALLLVDFAVYVWQDVDNLGLIDQWLGIDVSFAISRPTSIWTFPIETVSQSEGGFELVHQSVAVIPHWIVTGDANGRWTMTMALTLDTTLAESRMEPRAVATVV